MKSILEFKNDSGSNSLMISFNPIWRYWNETKTYPTSSTGMFSDIEATVLLLIREGEKQGVEMSTILNTRNQEGETLFDWATQYSEKIALALLQRSVTVNTIRGDFATPEFKVS